ncbi:hypothetical protein DTO021C3_5040 [Paecilomyces variotii]|nr:hypothetical protein DTO021C3_5040 [Paecilomyces variotii]
MYHVGLHPEHIPLSSQREEALILSNEIGVSGRFFNNIGIKVSDICHELSFPTFADAQTGRNFPQGCVQGEILDFILLGQNGMTRLVGEIKDWTILKVTTLRAFGVYRSRNVQRGVQLVQEIEVDAQRAQTNDIQPVEIFDEQHTQQAGFEAHRDQTQLTLGVENIMNQEPLHVEQVEQQPTFDIRTPATLASNISGTIIKSEEDTRSIIDLTADDTTVSEEPNDNKTSVKTELSTFNIIISSSKTGKVFKLERVTEHNALAILNSITF